MDQRPLRPGHAFESRTRCQIVASIDGSSFGSQRVAGRAMMFAWKTWLRETRKFSEASLSLAGPGYRLRVCLTILKPVTPLQTFSKVFPV